MIGYGGEVVFELISERKECFYHEYASRHS